MFVVVVLSSQFFRNLGCTSTTIVSLSGSCVLSFFLSQLHLLLPWIASYPLKNFQTATAVHHHAMSFNPKSFKTRFVTELQEKGQAVGFGTYNRA